MFDLPSDQGNSSVVIAKQSLWEQILPLPEKTENCHDY